MSILCDNATTFVSLLVEVGAYYQSHWRSISSVPDGCLLPLWALRPFISSVGRRGEVYVQCGLQNSFYSWHIYLPSTGAPLALVLHGSCYFIFLVPVHAVGFTLRSYLHLTVQGWKWTVITNPKLTPRVFAVKGHHPSLDISLHLLKMWHPVWYHIYFMTNSSIGLLYDQIWCHVSRQNVQSGGIKNSLFGSFQSQFQGANCYPCIISGCYHDISLACPLSSQTKILFSLALQISGCVCTAFH